MTCLHLSSDSHRWSTREVHQCLFSFVSEHQCNSQVSEGRPSEHKVSFLEQHDSDISNLPLYLRNLVELQHLDLGLGLLLLLKINVEMLA